MNLHFDRRLRASLLLGLALALSAVPAAFGQGADAPDNAIAAPPTTDLDLQLAARPAHVTVRDGHSFSGLLDGLAGDRLRLRLATDGGEVIYTIPTRDIASFEMPGDDLYELARETLERGDPATARPLLEALVRQRARYLPLLDAAQRRCFLHLIEACEADGDPVATIGYARLLEPHATTAAEHRLIRDSLLRAYATLGQQAEVEKRARRWCATIAYPPDSALGWVLLARQHLRTGDPERARWLALQPITFCPAHTRVPYLDEAYALAIAACDRLGDTLSARILFDEMRDRGLPWPEADPDLRPLARRYADPPAESAPAPRNASPLSPDPAGPAAERNLTLKDIRKLLTLTP